MAAFSLSRCWCSARRAPPRRRKARHGSWPGACSAPTAPATCVRCPRCGSCCTASGAIRPGRWTRRGHRAPARSASATAPSAIPTRSTSCRRRTMASPISVRRSARARRRVWTPTSSSTIRPPPPSRCTCGAGISWSARRVPTARARSWKCSRSRTTPR